MAEIAAAYGQQLGPERIKELAVLVGGGFLFRAFARQALTFVPGFGLPTESGGQFRFEQPAAGQAIFSASQGRSDQLE